MKHQVHAALTQWFTPRVRRQLRWLLTLALSLPWLVGEWAKLGMQPGLMDDALRQQQRIDFMVWGGWLFGFSMVIVWLCGTWVVGVMQGQQYLGDDFPRDPDDEHHPLA